MRNFRTLLFMIVGLAVALVGCDILRTPEECEADLEDMQLAVEQSVTSGQACQRDTECVLFNPSNSCFGSCPVAVNQNETPRITEEINKADFEFCRGFSEQCGFATPSCQTLEPACRSGQCVMIDRAEGP